VTVPDFLAITGPTASGKSALSIRVAERLDGEIVSMDSRQVYRGMDIGTDKIPPEARRRVPHHGLDLLDPDEGYSAGRFARQARLWIGEIRARGRVPIVVGGTGFFLRALVDPIFREPALQAERVRALRDVLAGWELDRLKKWVRVLDPERAPVATEGGPQRMMRTLEVALLSGRPLSWWHRTAGPEAPGLAGMTFLLELPRDELYRRINARVERMMERGLVEEVKGLVRAGYGVDDPGMSGTGYRETLLVLEGAIDRDEAVDRIRRATRRYARRQITWFRHQLPDDARPLDAQAPQEELVETIAAAWEESAGEAS
jgi:tRNA dimethylallyltransferase